MKPSVDVVSVDPRGSTVIAGRSEPDSKVTIVDGSKPIGEVDADGRGEWVFLPETELEPGKRVLTLRAATEDGTAAESDDAVIIVVPEKGTDIAGRETGKTDTPLIMVVPRAEGVTAPSQLVQAPAAGSEPEPKPADAAAAPPAPDSDLTRPSPLGSRVVRSFPEPVAPAPDPAGPAAPPAPPAPPSVAEAAPAPAPSAAAPPPEAAPAPTIALKIIDYDEQGYLWISGEADADATMQVYIDGKAVGQASSNDQGEWTLRPKQPVAVGRHSIRVDRLVEAGKVVARIELPFLRSAPLHGLPDGTVVIIQPGNNLWRIALRLYGAGIRYTAIYESNRDQIRDPDLIYPGQIFGLPKVY